jgi:flagellar FliL protein
MAEATGTPAEQEAAVAAAAAVAATDVVAPKKSKKLLFIILAVVVAIAGGGFYYMKHTAEQKRKAEEDENSVEKRLEKAFQHKKENKTPIFIPVDDFVVNLPGRGGEHYLQVKMVLRAADSKVEGRVKDFMPIIRDRVITVLSSRDMRELATSEGKNMMAKEVALVINAIIEPQLTAIYVLQQEPSTADLRNLERIGAVPKETTGGEQIGAAARQAAAQFWRVSEMDLPVQGVLFNSFVMQ